MNDGSIDVSGIAEALANVKKSEGSVKISEPEVVGDIEPTPPITPPAEPEAQPEAEPEQPRDLKPEISDRSDDIIVRKKRSKKSEKATTEPSGVADSSDDSDSLDASDSDTGSDTDNDDIGDGDDFGSSDSPNFKKLRESQRKYKKQTKQLQEEVEKLKPLTKYRDIVDLATSPEFHDAYSGTRETMVSQAKDIGELYGVNESEIRTIFESETIKEARSTLEDLVDDSHAVDEISSVIRDFYINKSKEAKELTSSDPKDSLQRLQEQREARMAQEKALKIKTLSQTKTKTGADLDVILNDDKQAETLWNGIYNKDLKKYIETDLPDKFKSQAKKNYEALFDQLTSKGAELSFEDSRKIAMLTSDAAGGVMANKIINILLDELSGLEKELKTQTGHSNPIIKQTKGAPSQPVVEEGPKTKEDKMLDLVSNLIK